ncbi:MAG: hypothetical protein Q7R33_05535 [Nitrosarchaeum sp.]|nr:hypothetical protein [Nitrosarchaeum sp.]
MSYGTFQKVEGEVSQKGKRMQVKEKKVVQPGLFSAEEMADVSKPQKTVRDVFAGEFTIPKPLNVYPYLGVDSKQMNYFGAYREHLNFTLALFNGRTRILRGREQYAIEKTNLIRPLPLEEDLRVHVLRALSPEKVLYFLAGFGVTQHVQFGEEWIDIGEGFEIIRGSADWRVDTHKNNQLAKLDDFVYDTCLVGMRFKKFFRLELPVLKVDIRLPDTNASLRELGKNGLFVRELYRQYNGKTEGDDKNVDPHFTHRHWDDKIHNPGGTGMIMRDTYIAKHLQHHGRDYMKGILSFLENAQVKS